MFLLFVTGAALGWKLDDQVRLDRDLPVPLCVRHSFPVDDWTDAEVDDAAREVAAEFEALGTALAFEWQDACPDQPFGIELAFVEPLTAAFDESRVGDELRPPCDQQALVSYRSEIWGGGRWRCWTSCRGRTARAVRSSRGST